MQAAPQSVSLMHMGADEGKGQAGPAAPPYAYPYPYPQAQPLSAGRPPPRDYVLWSLFNTFFLNACCLGFIALAFSFKSRDRKVIGDAEGATSYGKTARGLNIAALLVSILFIILFIVMLATGVIAMQQLTYQMQKEQRSTYEDIFQRNGK